MIEQRKTGKSWDQLRDLKEGKQPSHIYGLDGITRSQKSERDLNSLLSGLFKGPEGEEGLNYLRSITLNNVSGPGIEDHVLRHLEGQRFLFGIIQQRIDRGIKGI